MPTKNGSMGDITVEILKDIRTEMRGMRSELHEGLAAIRQEVENTNSRIDTLAERVDVLNERVESGFAELNKHMTATLHISGDYHKQLEHRMTVVEDTLKFKGIL